ncbi:MAG: 50S ribosomal protein L28 [Patescibacteria group bacterium]
MSRICLLTGKKANTANNRSHSNRATKRTQGVNLQTRRFNGVKLTVSASALKTLKKLKAIDKGEIKTKRAKKKAKTAARKAKAQK